MACLIEIHKVGWWRRRRRFGEWRRSINMVRVVSKTLRHALAPASGPGRAIFLPAAAAAAKAAAKVAQVAVAVAKWVAVAASLNLDCVQCHLRHFAKTLHVCDIVDNCFHNLMENLIKFTIKRAMLGTLPTVRFDVCSFSFLLPVRNELEKELYEHTAPSSFLFDVCMLPLRPVYFNIPDGTGNHGQLDLHVWRCWIKI